MGGVLTPTGVGTSVAENKRLINVDGKDYLLETHLFAERVAAELKNGSIVTLGIGLLTKALKYLPPDLTEISPISSIEDVKQSTMAEFELAFA